MVNRKLARAVYAAKLSRQEAIHFIIVWEIYYINNLLYDYCIHQHDVDSEHGIRKNVQLFAELATRRLGLESRLTIKSLFWDVQFARNMIK